MPLSPLAVPKWKEGQKTPLVVQRKWKSVDPGDIGPPPPPRAPQERKLSRKEEVAEAALVASQVLKVEIRGVDVAKDGTYSFAYDGERQLGKYLDQLELRRLATRNAVYDMSNLEAGRLRMTYVPSPDTTILIGARDYGPMSHLQRTNHDGQRLAKRIGTESVSMHYGPRPKTKERKSSDGVDQW
jgi:hypothetical protein